MTKFFPHIFPTSAKNLAKRLNALKIQEFYNMLKINK